MLYAKHIGLAHRLYLTTERMLWNLDFDGIIHIRDTSPSYVVSILGG
jgi:hypothetical protein